MSGIGKEKLGQIASQASGLSTPALAFLLPEICEKSACARVVLLTATESGAERLFRDLQFYFSFRPNTWAQSELLYLPGWEQSPYRNLQPSLSDRYERIRVSRRMMNRESSWITVAALPSFLQS